MKNREIRAGMRWALAALVVAGLCAPGAGAPAGRSPEGPLRVYLPADNATAGWTRDGGPQEFEGEDLYTYINGGAEIYQEYGFRRVVVQDYENPQGKSVSLEIFEMETPAAAFGMFTFKRSGGGKTLALGAGAELEAYYMNFWKGRFLVTLTGFDEAAETLEGLTAIGRIVDSALPEGREAPGLVAALPAEGLRPGSVKYLKGLLGLNNQYSFYTARGLAFTDAVRGLYDSGETLMILNYGSAEARHTAWLELCAELDRSERFERPDNYLADAVVFRDAKGLYVAFAETGTRLAVGIHSTLDWALATVSRVR
jgi:hypothetical protein